MQIHHLVDRHSIESTVGKSRDSYPVEFTFQLILSNSAEEIIASTPLKLVYFNNLKIHFCILKIHCWPRGGLVVIKRQFVSK